MPSQMNQELHEMELALQGFAANVSDDMKEQLKLTLKILLKLNAQINYTNTISAMLTGMPASPELNKKLILVNSGLTHQNHALQKLEQNLPKTFFLQNASLEPEQKAIASSMLNTLHQKIQALQEANKDLSDEAKKQLDEKLGKKADNTTSLRPPRAKL